MTYTVWCIGDCYPMITSLDCGEEPSWIFTKVPPVSRVTRLASFEASCWEEAKWIFSMLDGSGTLKARIPPGGNSGGGSPAPAGETVSA